MNLLITSAGRRVSLVRHFQKELHKVFPGSKVYTTEARPNISAACNISDGSFQVPLVTDSNYMSHLKNLIESHDIALVIPTIDAELLGLSENKSMLKEIGADVIISSKEFVSSCRNKRLIHEFFQSHNIDVATEYSKDSYKLPMFLKPYDGTRSLDTFLIRSESDLKPYHFENEKLMFLEYLDHDHFEEYTCDMYYDKSHILRCVVPRKRIEVRDGEVNKGVTERNDIVAYLRERLGTIPGAIGCLTAQFFKHKFEDRIVGIEINPRFGGGYPLSYHAGANYPKWLIQEYLLNEPVGDQFESWESNLLMMRYDDEILRHGYQG